MNQFSITKLFRRLQFLKLIYLIQSRKAVDLTLVRYHEALGAYIISLTLVFRTSVAFYFPSVENIVEMRGNWRRAEVKRYEAGNTRKELGLQRSNWLS